MLLVKFDPGLVVVFDMFCLLLLLLLLLCAIFWQLFL